MHIVRSLPRLGVSLLLVVQYVMGEWNQIGNDIDGENARDFAGGTQSALAMNRQGTTIAVGANKHDGDGGENAGHVRVFDYSVDDEVWVQRGDDIQGELAGDGSGTSVVLSDDGSVVGIGEPYSEGGNTGKYYKNFGQVRVFEWKNKSWLQRGEAIVGAAKYNFATEAGALAMDASGSTVIVGASNYDDERDGNTNSNQNSGHVRVFDWDGGSDSWVQRGNDINGETEGDWFGGAVAASANGNTVAVGALFNNVDEEAGERRGSVRIFKWNKRSKKWMQRGSDVDGEQDYDFSGSSVAMNDKGNVVAIGSPRTNAPHGDPERGSVTVYKWDGSDWQKRGTRIEGQADGDISGSTVALSAQGNTLAIGAYLNNGSTDNEGHVRVFDWDNESWQQRGNDIDGENKFDYSGYSIAMSADGGTLASGARDTNDVHYQGGHARIFRWSDGCGDSRFKESEDGKRHNLRIKRFPRKKVGSVKACNKKCAKKSGCIGVTWNPSNERKPCTTLKGSRTKQCGKDHVCCTYIK